ncbi:MAG: hypothetical protein ACK4R6_05030 [Spirosomataceae bacterium]
MSDIYKEQKFIGLCVFFFLLINFPLLGIFDKQVEILRVPLLIYYIASIWLAGIVLTAYWINKKESKDTNSEEDE